MSQLVFVDTNVLVYDQDAAEKEKQPVAHRWLEHLWQTARGRLSAQVLNEYYVTVTRRLNPRRSRELARADVQDLLSWRPVAIDSAVIGTAWDLEERFSLSWWDALVVAAAQIGGCAYLLTEDLTDGQDFDGVKVVDPFRHGHDVLD